MLRCRTLTRDANELEREIALGVAKYAPQLLELKGCGALIAGRADSIMYRQVLAELARARGWDVHLYEAKDVEARAANKLAERADEILRGPRATMGPPWAKDHRMALAATIVADEDGTGR